VGDIEKRPPAREVTLGDFEQFVLFAVLRLSPNAYGAAIHREIEKRTGRDPAIAAVYTTLDRLEKKGLLRSWVGEPTPERGGRSKKFYALEAVGAEALAQSYQRFRHMVAGLEKLLEKS